MYTSDLDCTQTYLITIQENSNNKVVKLNETKQSNLTLERQ